MADLKNSRSAVGSIKCPDRLINMPKRSKKIQRYDETPEFLNLLIHAIDINGVGFEIPYREKIFVKKRIIESNQVGFKKIGKIWAYVAAEGIDAFGFPRVLNFRTADGRQLPRAYACYDDNPDGDYIIYGSPYAMSLAEMVRSAAAEIAATDIAIEQNRIASQAPWVAVVKDENTRLSLENALRKKEDGEPSIIVNANIVDGLVGVSFNTPYIVEKLEQHRDAVRDRLFNKLGIMSANINKRERVQVGEVNSTVGQCLDYVYKIIDNVNEQFKYYDIPYEMTYNGQIEKLYTDGAGGEIINRGDNI